MPQFVYPLAVFVPGGVALFISADAIMHGIALLRGDWRRRAQQKCADTPDLGTNIAASLSSGVLLVLMGIASTIYIFVVFPKLLLLLPVLLANVLRLRRRSGR